MKARRLSRATGTELTRCWLAISNRASENERHTEVGVSQ